MPFRAGVGFLRSQPEPGAPADYILFSEEYGPGNDEYTAFFEAAAGFDYYLSFQAKEYLNR